MDEKIISVLIGVILGWLLSQGTEFFKEYLSRKRKIESIYIELSDLDAWLDRMLLGVKYSIQLFIINEPVHGVPAKLQVFILKEYFHEICMYLNRDVRIGFTDIYETINVINELIDELKPIINDYSDNQKEKLIGKLEAIYSNAYDMKFKTNFLLYNTSGDMEKLKGVALELDKKREKELNDLISEARELGAEKLKAKYFSE